MENNKEELFADLFAYRIYLEDIYQDNETEIIKKLKIKLYYLNIHISNVNQLLLEFYQYYNINITTEEIENARAFLIFNNNETNNNEINNNNILINRIISRLNVYNGIYNINDLIMNINNQNEEEANQTITENDFNNSFIAYKYTNKNTNEITECSICIDTIQEEQEVIKLSCNHIFHHKCIKSYLLNYNNKCPLCRTSCI